jgi:hypothetical protein
MRTAALALAFLPLLGCLENEAPLTDGEVNEALQAVLVSQQGAVLTGSAVQVSTSFTLGDAWEDAVENTRAFYESQIPCSSVSVADRTVTLDFGNLDDACTFEGQTYAGLQTLTFDRVEPGLAEVTHGFSGFTDGITTLDGDATVTWDVTAGTRRVVHDGDWTRSDGEVLTATGDRTQRLVDESAGFAAGIQIDGERAWTWKDKDWKLDIDGVQARAIDPVPQAGSYVLTTPRDKTLTLLFERLDADTIRMTLDGGAEPRVFEVTALGMDEVDAG